MRRAHVVSTPISWRRIAADRAATALSYACAAAVLLPLVCVLGYMVWKGLASLNWAFIARGPVPAGMLGGGMANAILGSFLLLLMASAMGGPVGIAAGVYLAEYGRGTRFGQAVRFTADVLNGIPSIVFGIVLYLTLVLRQHHFCAFAGAVALAMLAVPPITRTTEEMLLNVPQSLRDAALGLGAPRWRTVVSVVLRTAAPGVTTGCMLAFARISGETAPLLFTAFGNQFVSMHPNEPIAALPLQIFTYAMSPYDDWHRMAWAGSLVLLVLIALSVAAMRFVAGYEPAKEDEG